MSLDEQWTEIAQEAIEKAEKVKCSLEAFYSGLGEIIALIRARKQIEDEGL